MQAHAPEAGLASLLASRGRNGDSVLVHMTPGELNGLHQLAFAAGGQLTVNPHTGLYEANFLKKLLPTLLGFGLNFLVPGLGALGSSLLVGGVEAARTGDLSKGLMAGLGAYGGASLGSALSTAGAQTAKTAAEMSAANVANVGGTAGGAAAGFVPGGVQAGMTVADAATKALAPEAFKNVAAADITKANLSAGLEALKAAPSTTLKAVGSRLGPTGIAGLGTTASSLMTPELKPYDPEDPTFYMSGGYDPYTGFKPGYYSKTYKPFGAAMGGIIPRPNPSYPMGAMQTGARSFLDTNAPREVVGGYDALINPMTGQERPQVNFAEGGETKKPASAANVQYRGSDAEKLQQYMQNLNQSFIPAPPPPAPPPAAIAPPGAGNVYTAGPRLPNFRGILSGINRDELRNYGVNIRPEVADMIFGPESKSQFAPSGYSKPVYRMTADEKAAEDAAMAAARQNVAQSTAPTTPFSPTEPDYSGFDFSNLQDMNFNMSGVGGSGSYMPQPPAAPPPYQEPVYQPPAYQEPVYQPPAYQEPVYQPPIEDRTPFYAQPVVEDNYPIYQEPMYQPPAYQEPVYQTQIPSMPRMDDIYTTMPVREDNYPIYQEPMYQPPAYQAPVFQPPAYQEPVYQPPAYQEPVYQPPAYQEPVYQPPAYQEPVYQPPAYEEPISYGLGQFDQNFDRFGNEYNFAFAKGGVARRGRKKRKQTPVAGKLVNGKGDGMSDSIRANINGDQEARLTDGEFVIPADVVSHLGNGSTDAGSKKLYDMMARVRKARTGRSHQAPQVNIDKMMPR